MSAKLPMLPTEDSASLDYIPPDATHPELARAVTRCRGCDLYKRATAAVFGEGSPSARLMLIGEQPGDHEDREGRPFVGPAGRLLDAALADARIPRDRVYLTNAVKHFKWEPRGKRRLHSKPNAAEVQACRGWLETEIALVEPEVIVCLGATAAQLFLGRSFRLTTSRGEPLDGDPWAKRIMATYHPSALLRMMSDEAAYEQNRRSLVKDLATAAELAGLQRSRGTTRSSATASKRSRPASLAR